MLSTMTETTTPERREILQRARAVRTLAKHRRWAEEMRAAGWLCVDPTYQEARHRHWAVWLRANGWTVLEPGEKP